MSKIEIIKERDFGIDIVKFLAVLMIINSHADVMYPKYQVLATGGAIGDCLFLFCSGFTLFWGGQKTFGAYYKRRISRIFPSVFAAAMFTHCLSMNPSIHYLDLLGGEFIIAIMIYYVLLYFIRKYAINNLKWILGMLAIVSLIVYVLWFPYKYEVSSKGIYGITTLYRWIPYFGAMLLGAIIGLRRKELKYNAWWDFVKLLICVAVFYSIQFAAKFYRPIAPWQVVTLLPLMGITVYFYKWCNAGWMKRIYDLNLGNWIIMVIGGLCLESYLIQYSLFTDKMNSIWPLNLIIIVLVILICSYMVRCVARWFAQTFRTEDYEWKKIFALK